MAKNTEDKLLKTLERIATALVEQNIYDKKKLVLEQKRNKMLRESIELNEKIDNGETPKDVSKD